ncbi:sigma-70 family RNA polymerase sigma factor [Bradyrhizobium sp. BR13661]|jgi:RNA polymerase sigma-70 factor (ECF subfamily)|uniref:sigma-70 family RNA polymerase sigma factor n=1 Tax=Bradyrhizobium sp. BR13661 TaxID=2940622 RepID=UPI00247361FB|nr:sigma-70 family RNA polymerase sigma factor [Bradyrhizobium sp. BR13661]MDH6259454.1 RNA polymerase sigma-70 factor (ECF subfamily) [Bradyrhizobium sp. BR13661]
MSCGRLTARDPLIERLSDLLARVGRGDQRAFAELFAATRNKLRKTARPFAPVNADLDDLLQDAYLKIWKHAAHFDPGRSSPITWMCAIMRNTAIDAARLKQVPTAELDEALAVPDAAASEDAFDYDLVEPIAARAIERLPDQRRQLLSRAYLEGESRLMLAQRFGVPVGTIKTWLRRTVASLRDECLACTPNVVAPRP